MPSQSSPAPTAASGWGSSLVRAPHQECFPVSHRAQPPAQAKLAGGEWDTTGQGLAGKTQAGVAGSTRYSVGHPQHTAPCLGLSKDRLQPCSAPAHPLHKRNGSAAQATGLVLPC